MVKSSQFDWNQENTKMTNEESSLGSFTSLYGLNIFTIIYSNLTFKNVIYGHKLPFSDKY